MSTMHDFYDPRPAPRAMAPPAPPPLQWTTADLMGLLTVCLLLVAASAAAWRTEPAIGLLTALSGFLVVLESWFTSLEFLHLHPEVNPAYRMRMFLAALVPWAIGLGIAVALMFGLFALSDLFS